MLIIAFFTLWSCGCTSSTWMLLEIMSIWSTFIASNGRSIYLSSSLSITSSTLMVRLLALWSCSCASKLCWCIWLYLSCPIICIVSINILLLLTWTWSVMSLWDSCRIRTYLRHLVFLISLSLLGKVFSISHVLSHFVFSNIDWRAI